ncbi:YppG family protein [Aciduricibacillus chroicocephali]|uniref:YppG family protein n=1 Tax=Aciduricibacillus chroicocephali TaxID=3054939 RepID=A0ABY9KXN9_9BACI|nr:YppG family protein [Bacillaceae bacterium 44XB]
MLNRRSFRQQPFYKNGQMPLGYGDASQMPTEMSPVARQTPYDYFRKPAQPENLLGRAPVQNPNQQTSGLMSYFQNEDGEFDMDKFFATTGQVTNLFQRVAPLVMRLTSVLKG